MAKLTRKLWVGIGAATLAGASVAGGAMAQDVHKGHKDGPASAAEAKSPAENPAEGGEAYLTDGGPRDTRIRFYRDIALMRGHLLVGGQLIELELWDEALPHFLHPTEELYGLMEKYIKLHNIRPFSRELQALAQAVKAKRKGAYEQALKVVDQRLEGALAVARKFMTPLLGFTAKSAAVNCICSKTSMRWRTSSACGSCSTIWRRAARWRICSAGPSGPRACASSSARRTSCFRSRVPRPLWPPTPTLPARLSAFWG